MNADNYCVYMHINKTNDKKYIGITKQKPENRWKNGLGYKDNTYFYRAIQKYSWSNFEHIIVTSNLSLENACKMEIEFIAKYKSSNPQYGYNIASGGNVNIPSKEGIEKIRCSMIGKKLSEETKRKLSECRKGEKNPNYGKYGEHSTHSRKIDQYDLNHNFIKTWGSLIDIKRELGYT